jgi:ABC-type uncharacterized transport system permease subunit
VSEPLVPQDRKSQPEDLAHAPPATVASRLDAFQRAGGIITPVLTALLAFLIGGLLVLGTGHNPFTAYWDIINGAGLNWLAHPWDTDIATTAAFNFSQTLLQTTTLILCGLAVAFAFRCGLFNIGGNGQYLMGLVVANWVGVSFVEMTKPAHIVLGMGAAALAGAAWAGIAGFLKATVGAHEVITTIMLNYVAAQILFFALRGPILRQPGSTAPVSKNMQAFVDVPLLINLPAIRLDLSFIVALVMAVAVSWLLFRTTKGFELRAAGFNMTAARYAGMSAGGSMMLAMALSGALLGLAGSFLVVGTVGQLSLDLSEKIGFNGIALALLAGLRPSRVVAAALLFGALSNGGKVMGIQAGVPFDLLFFIMALVIMFVAAPGLIRAIWRIRVTKPQPELAISQQPVASE